MKFNERIKKLRTENKFTQRGLAKELGVTHSSIRDWEAYSQTSFEMLVKIAKFFQVSTDYLLGLKDID